MHEFTIEDTTNFFKGLSDGSEFTGLNLILGGFAIHVLEGEAAVVNKMLQALDEYQRT